MERHRGKSRHGWQGPGATRMEHSKGWLRAARAGLRAVAPNSRRMTTPRKITIAMRADIVRRVLAGESGAAIARAHRISRRRVRWVCGLANIELPLAKPGAKKGAERREYAQVYREPGPLKDWPRWAVFGVNDAARARLRRLVEHD